MDAFKTIGAFGGLLLGMVSGVWSVGVTFGRSEVATVRAEVEANKKGSDQVHAAQDDRFRSLSGDLQQLKETSNKTAEDSAATRALVEERFGVRRAGGHR